MTFRLQLAGVEELNNQGLAEVVINRSLYTHSRATATFHWQEVYPYGERQATHLAARALNSPVSIQWQDNDLGEAVDCFQGYVEGLSGLRRDSTSTVTLECVSYSLRTDLVPRYRAFQACRLLDICQHIARREPGIRIVNSADLDFEIPLSVQYGETDYAYLRRMLYAWGVPMAVTPNTGDVLLGARATEARHPFPTTDFRWTSVNFSAGVAFCAKPENYVAGPVGIARNANQQLNGQLDTTANTYHPFPETAIRQDRLRTVQMHNDTAQYDLEFNGFVLPFSPGEIVSFENQTLIIQQVQITGDERETAVRQKFELQPYSLPYQPGRTLPNWPSRTLLAHVVDNENDPLQQGRVQVQFEVENLDPQPSGDKVWLDTLTPYGGGKSVISGKVREYSGFYALPEVGERVLVQFLGDWDSEAVVLGSVREASVSPMNNAKHTKRWRTPSGNELTFTTRGDTDLVRIRCRDRIFLESQIEAGRATVHITPGEADTDYIHFEQGADVSRLDILCSGEINIKAARNLHLEGGQVQIRAGSGGVNVDGAPMVMINCGARSMVPLVLPTFEEEKLPVRARPRKQPASLADNRRGDIGAATGGNKSSSSADTKKVWLDILLQDKNGIPVPHERYRVMLPDGSVREGRLDAEGRARVHGVARGTARISFPDYDPDHWRPA